MAKRSYILARLMNEEVETGTVYIVHLATKGEKQGQPIRKRKYDPVTKKHHWFKTRKMPSHAKN